MREQPGNWQLDYDDHNIAWLTLNVPGSGPNVLSEAVLDELGEQLDRLRQEPPTGVVIGSAKEGGFIAGADIKAFTALEDEAEAKILIERGQRRLDRLATLPFPTLALIHGHCLGGGLELALACDYRIAEEGAQLGLPEVRLGIFPGFGGTLRLPRLIGELPALQMMLDGRTRNARRARRLGLVDQVVPARQLQRAARHRLLALPARHRPSLWRRLPGWGPLRPLTAWAMARLVRRRLHPEHYPAPFALLDHWRRCGGRPLPTLNGEVSHVASLITGTTARNLIRVFLLRERLKRLGDRDRYTPHHLHVVGAGVMGGDIAAWAALQGLTVTLQDRHAETLAKAVTRAATLFRKRLRDPRRVDAALDRLIPDLDGVGVGRAEVVIEAIVEDIDAKRTLFAELEPRLRDDAILATNTSSIPLEQLADGLARPERLVGLHFFNPVSRMELVEVVAGEQSGDEALERARAFVRHIDRLPLPVKSSPGFLVNRVLMPYLMEGVQLETEGVPPRVVDRAATGFGMPMGPLRLADTVGLDICLSVARILGERLDLELPKRLLVLVESGRLGVKSGHGFYRYRKGHRLHERPPHHSRHTRDMTERLMLRYINEAVACLREGVVDDPDLIDAGLIFGSGFAPFLGGPLHYLEQSGLSQQRQQLEALSHHYGHRFDLDAGWDDSRLLHHG